VEANNKPVVNEPVYRLNVKKNYKGSIAWEYTVKGDTLDEIDARNKAMRTYINENVEKKEDVAGGEPEEDDQAI